MRIEVVALIEGLTPGQVKAVTMAAENLIYHKELYSYDYEFGGPFGAKIKLRGPDTKGIEKAIAVAKVAKA